MLYLLLPLLDLNNALDYCRNLSEGGYDDWFLPTVDDLLYSLSGGVDIIGEIEDDSRLWTRTPINAAGGTGAGSTTNVYTIKFNFSPGNNFLEGNNANVTGNYCVCARFAKGETSEGSSGSSNSSESGSSILGSEQPITMIGPIYYYQDFPEFLHTNTVSSGSLIDHGNVSLKFVDAYRFCQQLSYNGYSDWFLPSLNQVIHYMATYNLIVIDNLSNFLEYGSDLGSLGYSALSTGTTILSFWTKTENKIFGLYINGASETWNGQELDFSGMITGFSQPFGSNYPCLCVR